MLLWFLGDAPLAPKFLRPKSLTLYSFHPNAFEAESCYTRTISHSKIAGWNTQTIENVYDQKPTAWSDLWWMAFVAKGALQWFFFSTESDSTRLVYQRNFHPRIHLSLKPFPWHFTSIYFHPNNFPRNSFCTERPRVLYNELYVIIIARV